MCVYNKILSRYAIMTPLALRLQSLTSAIETDSLPSQTYERQLGAQKEPPPAPASQPSLPLPAAAQPRPADRPATDCSPRERKGKAYFTQPAAAEPARPPAFPSRLLLPHQRQPQLLWVIQSDFKFSLNSSLMLGGELSLCLHNQLGVLPTKITNGLLDGIGWVLGVLPRV